MRAVPATFRDQLAIIEELLREVQRMDEGEKRASRRRSPDSYERELRLVLGFVARRIDRAPVTGEDWHKKLISRCARSFDDPKRPAVISAALAEDLLELCEFRHVVRNIYPTRLDETKVRERLAQLIRAARAFGEECKTFAARRRRPA